MINRAIVILSVICTSLLSFNGTPPPAPTLISPPNGSSFETTATLSLDWESSPGAVQYFAHLWGGSGVDINSGWITHTDWLFGELDPGTYSWQVKARGFTGESAWSATWNFTVTGPQPQVRVTRVWTGDGSWNPKTTFDPGEPIQWVIDIENLTDAQMTIDVTYLVQLDNGDTIAYWHGTLTTIPGTLSWGLPGTLPVNRGGTHIFSGSVEYQGLETQSADDYSVTGSYVDFIFADGFESGNLLHWTSRKTNYGDLSVSFTGAMIGNKTMRALIDDDKLIYVTDATPYRESRYRARFYFDPNSIAMQNLDDHRIFIGYDHEGELIPILRLELRRFDNTYQVRAGARNDDLSTWANSNWITISDNPHYFELVWQAASCPEANDGVLRLLIDGVMQANRGNIDNDTFHLDEINLGAVAGIDTGTRGAYYFDAFKSTHTKFIGPALAESVNELALQEENVITGPPTSK